MANCLLASLKTSEKKQLLFTFVALELQKLISNVPRLCVFLTTLLCSLFQFCTYVVISAKNVFYQFLMFLSRNTVYQDMKTCFP